MKEIIAEGPGRFAAFIHIVMRRSDRRGWLGGPDLYRQPVPLYRKNGHGDKCRRVQRADAIENWIRKRVRLMAAARPAAILANARRMPCSTTIFCTSPGSGA